MHKLLLFLTACFCCHSAFAQTPTLQQKFYYTCKIWGFVKYYHCNVSNCNVNWDSVLITVLRAVESAATDSAFNDAPDTIVDGKSTALPHYRITHHCIATLPYCPTFARWQNSF